MEKRIVKRKSIERVKFDLSLWTKIKDYVLENYTSLNITVKHHDEACEFADFDSAYNLIAQHTDHITNIDIYAQSDDERLSVNFKNYKEHKFKDRFTIKLEAECPNHDRANHVLYFMIHIIQDYHLPYRLLQAMIIAIGVLVINEVVRTFPVTLSTRIANLLLDFFFLCIGVGIITVIYEAIGKIIKGKRQIFFCTDDVGKNKFESMKTKYNIVVTLLVFVLIIIITAMYNSI